MNSLLLERGMDRVAIVDDEQQECLLKSIQLRRIGFSPYIVPGEVSEIDELLDRITEHAQVAVCDHDLHYGAYASFYGAEAVAKLYERGIPAILITQFYNMDDDVDIRRWRKKIPVILSKDEANPHTIAEGLSVCLREQEGDFRPDRMACRTQVQIARKRHESNQEVVDVIIPSWNPRTAVRFPVALIPEELHDYIEVGQVFIAKVNTGADHYSDLYFDDFELAPDPIPEDEVG